MSGRDDVLLRLGDSTADAVVGVLELFSPGGIERGQPAVPAEGPLLGALPMPAVAASITYVDGVSGGNIFGMPRLAARRLAAAMMMQDPSEVDGDDELSELELSAIGEAMNQMMAAAAAATSTVLGEEVDISPPETRFFTTHDEVEGAYELTPHVVVVPFSLFGEPCRLVQLVPNAFVVRMTRAFDEMAAEIVGPDGVASGAPGVGDAGGVQPDDLLGATVRVWAELGRCRLPVGRAAALEAGEVVVLDSETERDVDLFVNGRRFASGTLVLVDGEEWGVRVTSAVAAEAEPFPEAA